MKKLQITAPEGFEIDQNKSDLSKGIVFFKEIKKILRYEDIASKLFFGKDINYIGIEGEINTIYKSVVSYLCLNVSSTKQQLESILALNQLCNVAKYLNGVWLPDFVLSQKKFYISCDEKLNPFTFSTFTQSISSNVFFKSRKKAQQAIEILGEETIRKALTLNY